MAIDHDEEDAASDPPSAYTFDPSHVAISVEVLDHAFSAAERWDVSEVIRRELRQRGRSDTDELARELVRIPYWRLRTETDPKVSTSRLPYPGIDDLVTPAVIELWCAIEPLLTSQAARATIADLLWEQQVHPRATYARHAIDSHLERAAGVPGSLESTDSILRAWDLARRIRDVERAVRAETDAITAVESALEGGDYTPGITLPLLSLLTSQPVRGHMRDAAFAPALNLLLERALINYSFHDAGDVIALMRRVAGTAEDVARLEARHTKILLDQAIATPDGLLKQMRLEEVVGLARNYGQSEIVAEATAALQSISQSSLGMQRIESTHTIPIDVRESALDRYTRGRDWRDGLDAFLFSPPPTGERTELERQAQKYLDAGYIHTLFTRVSLTREGLPSHRSEPGDLDHAMAFQAAFRVAGYGEIMATGLSRVAHRFGTPSVDRIAQHLIVRGAADRDLVDALARALHLYWNDDYDAALHVITPRVETAARSLLRELDIAIYRTQVGKTKGGYVGLHTLLEQLENLALDPDWAYYLRHILLGPHGMNLRNDVAHGLLAGPDAVTAVLALRAAALLILMAGPATPTDWDEATDGSPTTNGNPFRSPAEARALLQHPVGSSSAHPVARFIPKVLARTGEKLMCIAFALALRATRKPPRGRWRRY